MDTRWRVTLGSGSRLRVEYRQAWEYMRQETMKCADYLGGMRLWSCFPCGRSWRGQLYREDKENSGGAAILEKLRGGILKQALQEYGERRAFNGYNM